MVRTVLQICIFCFAQVATAQMISVRSAGDGEPVPFVNAVLNALPDGDTIIMSTDISGNIQLQGRILTEKSYAITISCIGFKKLCDTLYAPIQTGTLYLQSDNISLDEVVVTAQYAPGSPERSVHKVKIIGNKKIQSMGAQNLRDVLSNELNMRIAQDNILGSSMNIQGISGQNVKILVDGVPVTGRLNGNIDISQINMYNVERIEIIEGPLSVNYGTDALAGTINIITKKTQEETFEVHSFNYYESNGQYNTTGSAGFRKNNEIITLTGGRHYFDGWRYGDKPFYIEQPKIADSLRYKDWKPKEQYFATLYYGHYFKNIKTGYTADYFQEQITNKGLPRKPYYETAFDDYYFTKRLNNAISLSGPLNSRYYLNGVISYNYFERIKNTFFNDLTTLEETLTENFGDQDTTVFKVFMTRGSISTTGNTKLNWELGYDINNETGAGIRIKDGSQQITDYALFTTAEYKPAPAVIIRPGVRFIYNTTYKAPVVPSVNLRWQASDKNAIRFSYARGFRAPSLKELFFYFVDVNHNIVGSENLKAEYSHSLNLALSNAQQYRNVYIKSEVSAFYNYIENLITLAQQSETQYSYFNVDIYQTLGIQLQSEFSWQHFRTSLGAAYTGRYNQLAEEFAMVQFDWSPELQYNLYYEWQGFSAALFYKYTGALPLISTDAEGTPVKTLIAGYSLADISLTRVLWDGKCGISLGCKNIFDVVNIASSVPGSAHSSGSNSISIGMGRTYFLKFDIHFNSGR